MPGPLQSTLMNAIIKFARKLILCMEMNRTTKHLSSSARKYEANRDGRLIKKKKQTGF